MKKPSQLVHIGSKISKYGKVVEVIKIGTAGNKIVWGLSDDTMIFADDLDNRQEIKLLEDSDLCS